VYFSACMVFVMGASQGARAEGRDAGGGHASAFGLTRAEDEQRLKRVFKFFEEQKFDLALGELQPVLDFQPGLVSMQELACELWARRAPEAAETVAQCAKAGALPGAGPISWLHLARAQHADPAAAVVSLGHAAAALEAVPSQPFVWRSFAELALEHRCLTWVEAAAAHLESADSRALLDAVARHRRRLGAPVGALAADREAAFSRLAADAQRHINLDEPKPAAALVARAEAEFPSVAGTLALRCALDEVTHKAATAKKACAAALALQPDNLLARLVSSSLSPPEAAIADLTAIIGFDPAYELAYRRLAALYRKRKDGAALKRLEDGYMTQFKRPLPR